MHLKVCVKYNSHCTFRHDNSPQLDWKCSYLFLAVKLKYRSRGRTGHCKHKITKVIEATEWDTRVNRRYRSVASALLKPYSLSRQTWRRHLRPYWDKTAWRPNPQRPGCSLFKHTRVTFLWFRLGFMAACSN